MFGSERKIVSCVLLVLLAAGSQVLRASMVLESQGQRARTIEEEEAQIPVAAKRQRVGRHSLRRFAEPQRAGVGRHARQCRPLTTLSLCRFLAKVETCGVKVRPVVVEGANVAQAIARVADEQQSDLIVLGSRGRSRSSAVLLGSEAEHTLIETSVPILVVKHYGAHLGVLQALLNRKFLLKQSPRFG